MPDSLRWLKRRIGARAVLSVCALAVFHLLTAGPCSGQDLESIPDQLGRIVTAYHEADRFQGAVLVAMKGEVIFRQAYGRADVEWNIPNTPETIFTIASLGKAFTAALILQLRDEGHLSLDDKVNDHLPGFSTEIGERVRVRHLLGHTGGIPWPQDDWAPEQFARRYELDELIQLVRQQDLLFVPGSEFQYCNSCYHILAAIIESITQQSFEAALRARILIPLGMSNTGIAYADTILPMRAAGYEKLDSGTMVNALLQDQSYALGAGGMYSTVDDLYRWHESLNGDLILSDSSRTAMFTPGVGSSGFGWGMGKYVMHGHDDLRTLAVGFGGTPGFASGMARLLDDDYFIVFLGNIRQIPQNRLMNDLWNTILGFDVELFDE